MDPGTIRGLGTVILMLAFVGLVVWAWSPQRRRRFDAAARLPLEEDDLVGSGLLDGSQGGRDHE
jgi:cbb3-type cytochrome oxidase subunit 3